MGLSGQRLGLKDPNLSLRAPNLCPRIPHLDSSGLNLGPRAPIYGLRALICNPKSQSLPQSPNPDSIMADLGSKALNLDPRATNLSPSGLNLSPRFPEPLILASGLSILKAEFPILSPEPVILASEPPDFAPWLHPLSQSPQSWLQRPNS